MSVSRPPCYNKSPYFILELTSFIKLNPIKMIKETQFVINVCIAWVVTTSVC